MKEIRRKLPAIAVILLTVLLIPGIVNAKAQKEYQGDRWNFKKTIKESSGAFTYYAYPSKNQKEAWIYKIQVKRGKDYSKLSIPSKLDGKKVTRLGARRLEYYERYNILGQFMQPNIDSGEYGKYGWRIRKLTIPDTVKVIQPLTFACMCYIQTVKVPKQVRTLEEYTFYGCLSLKKAELPAGLKSLDAWAFWRCPKLTKMKLPQENKTYQVDGKCVIKKKKKELVYTLAGGQTLQVPEGVRVLKKYAFNNCTSKKVHIPASVKKIEGGAFQGPHSFSNTYIHDVTVDDGNSVYGKDGQCIYNKLDNSLSVAIWSENSVLYISDKVERLTEDISTVEPDFFTRGRSSKVVYPKNLKIVVDNAMNLLFAHHIYYTGENPPKLVKENSKEKVRPPIYTHVYVPEGSEELYWQWYSEYEYSEDDYLEGWDTFKPEDTI